MASTTSAVLMFIVITIVENSSANNKQMFHDLPCLSAFGGFCVLSSECPKGNQVPIKGLCPMQRDGVECCYSLPISETRCQKKGGQCIQKKQKCPDNLTFLRATDCGVDELCCILV